EPGLQAIEDCIAIGRSINVTLVFSLQRYREVVEAYLRGLERLVEGGGDPAKVRSVASFFVSRVDTETDKRLDAIGTDEALALLDRLAAVGIDYDDVVLTLEKEGVQKFSDSFKELLDGVLAKRGALVAS